MDKYSGLLYSQETKTGKDKITIASNKLSDATAKAMRFCIETCTGPLDLYIRGRFEPEIDKKIEQLQDAIHDKEILKERQNNETAKENIGKQIASYQETVKTLSEIEKNVLAKADELDFHVESVFDTTYSNAVLSQLVYPNAERHYQKLIQDKIQKYKRKIEEEEKSSGYDEYEDEDSVTDDDTLSVYEEIEELKKLQGNGPLTECFRKEKEYISILLRDRNQLYGHIDNTKNDIAIDLNKWGNDILDYLEVIKNRLTICSAFGEYVRENKDSFLYQIRKQRADIRNIRQGLVVGENTLFLDFFGETYELSSERNDLDDLLADMGEHWHEGKAMLLYESDRKKDEINRYIEKATSPQKYYEFLRWKGMFDSKNDGDYYYFKFLYMNGVRKQKKIMWRERGYTESQFATHILYKYMKVRDAAHLEKRLDNWTSYTSDINLRKWAEHHLLSTFCQNNIEKKKIALDFENALNAYHSYSHYETLMESFVSLFFVMYRRCFIFYDNTQGRLVQFNELEDAQRYFEDGDNFLSVWHLRNVIRELNESVWFRCWRNFVKSKHE